MLTPPCVLKVQGVDSKPAIRFEIAPPLALDEPVFQNMASQLLQASLPLFMEKTTLPPLPAVELVFIRLILQQVGTTIPEWLLPSVTACPMRMATFPPLPLPPEAIMPVLPPLK